MNIEQLYYFYEAANSGSFSSAANKIFTTPQNLSKAISKLESELGKKLFVRKPHGVQLTSDGLTFYEKVAHLLQEYNQLKANFVANSSESIQSSLNICSTPNINTTFLPTILRQLYSIHPNISINIQEENMDSILPYSLKNDYLGIAFFLNSYFSNTLLPKYGDELFFESIYNAQLGICANKNSELALKKSISLEEALQHPFICNTWSSWASSGFPLVDQNKIISTTSQELIDLFTSKNKAISFVLKDFLFNRNSHHNIANQMVFIPLKEGIVVSAIIFKSIYYPLSEIENTFISLARDTVKDLQTKHNYK